MSRFWMQTFGSSLAASRFLPALLSLLSLPLIYGLAWELFQFRLAAWLAAIFLALSPFDLLFAQTARQYSLLTVTIIGSSYFLLRGIRSSTWKNWGLYTLFSTIGLYAHPFLGLTLIAHFSFLFCHWLTEIGERTKKITQQNLFKFLLASVLTTILYSPWLIILKNNAQRMQATTDWARVKVEFIYLVKLWILSFTSLFLDLDFGFNSVWTYILRLLILTIIIAAIYQVCRQTQKTTWLFILTSIFIPFLILVIPDLILGGKRSAVSRYLISSYPAIQLAVAYFFATKIIGGQKFWRAILALLLTGTLASLTLSAMTNSWWSKDLSYSNAEVAKLINSASFPLVISDIGDDYTNTGDLISLSYQLNDDVNLLLVSKTPSLKLVQGESNVFVFRPSGNLWQTFKQEKIPMKLVYPPGNLWRIQPKVVK